MESLHARLVCLALLSGCGLVVGCWRKEGFVALGPATYLGWTGTEWEICDDANRTRGIDSLPGGVVIVEQVVAVQVVDKLHLLAKDSAGKRYLITVDEWGPDEVQSFATEAEWLDAAKAAGLGVPHLRKPAELYR